MEDYDGIIDDDSALDIIMIEEMENSGVVSAVQSNGSREVIAPPVN